MLLPSAVRRRLSNITSGSIFWSKAAKITGSSETEPPQGREFTSAGGGVEKRNRTSSAKAFPLEAFVPAGTVTVNSVAFGRRLRG